MSECISLWRILQSLPLHAYEYEYYHNCKCEKRGNHDLQSEQIGALTLNEEGVPEEKVEVILLPIEVND